MTAPERSDKDGTVTPHEAYERAMQEVVLWCDTKFGETSVPVFGAAMRLASTHFANLPNPYPATATLPECGSSPTPRTSGEPTWGQLDATVRQHDLKTKSLMDTAELIWRLERELATMTKLNRIHVDQLNAAPVSTTGDSKITDLLKQARKVRNFSQPDDVFEAVPVSCFDAETVSAKQDIPK